MPIQIEVRANHLRVRWSGTIVPPDLAQLFGELPAVAARCGFTPHVLHTVDPGTALNLETLEAFNYSKRRTCTPIPVPVRGAFVAHTPAAIALARTFGDLNRNPNLTLKSFLTEVDAVAWLVGRDDAEPGRSDKPSPRSG
jgi:hypothetical protein